MSVTLREVIEAGGYDINDVADAEWLLGTQSEYEDLIEHAENTIDTAEEEDENDE